MPQLDFMVALFDSGTSRSVSSFTTQRRTCNTIPEVMKTPGQKTPISMIQRGGLDLLNTLPTSPVRGTMIWGNQLFAVAGTHVYLVNTTTGAVTTDYGAMPGSSGTGPVTMIHNDTQVMVLDGGVNILYHANVSPPVNVLAAFSVDYLEGFFYALDNASTRRIRQSAFLDGTTWPALDYVDDVTSSDDKVSLKTVNGQLWVFGLSNIDVWSFTGNNGFALENVQSINQGNGGWDTYGRADFTTTRIGNTVFWLGNNEDRGGLAFFMAQGYDPVRISDPGIEALLQPGFGGGFGDISGAYSFACEIGGHVFYITQFPHATSNAYAPEVPATAGATLAYDLTTKLWSEWYYGVAPTITQHLASCTATLKAGTTSRQFVGDYSSGKIYLQSPQYQSDAGTEISQCIIGPYISNKFNRIKHNNVILDAFVPAISTPTISWDDGLGFTTPRAMMLMESLGSGPIQRYAAFQLGIARFRAYRILSTRTNISNLWLDVGEND